MAGPMPTLPSIFSVDDSGASEWRLGLRPSGEFRRFVGILSGHEASQSGTFRACADLIPHARPRRLVHEALDIHNERVRVPGRS